ncbi:PorP/SprF family type IX secretion system membrane protein [Pontibacter sp. E15-1]|uniref:PorP/SprF family type IX secretion system membrane protein n=1 Tax=Pontibacter sp. E15-1 TaxID=2919918 RepID=UPI001F50169F|nr:PorP/SprF family type IX secretion system membrane protein [Pontibacter sp. E15-1]MCJ8163787.1 PorP/SprF family type IX secretion system membrane protein [Pontibacter sp. E15-1]
MVCVSCLCALAAAGQDVHLTQQYANRLYLNPAFAGINSAWRVALAHRNQWPALNGSFRTSQLTADYRLPDTKSAVSLLVQQDRAGIGGLQKWQLSGGYAYHTNLTENWAMSAGLQASVASLRVSSDNLVFGDQLSDNGLVALTSAEARSFEPGYYLDFTVGGLAYTRQFWVGLTAAHLNRPGYGFNQETELPLRFTAIAGYKFYAKSYEEQGQLFELSFLPTATFIQQQNLTRLDIGLYTIYTPLTLGFIYKGVPMPNGTNQDKTLAVLLGLELQNVRVGYSHDIGLQGFSAEAGGANEISLIFEPAGFKDLFQSRNNHKLNRNIVCPAF